MENSNEKIADAIKKLMELKKETTDEVLKNASKEQLKKYIELSEEIEAKMKVLLEN